MDTVDVGGPARVQLFLFLALVSRFVGLMMHVDVVPWEGGRTGEGGKGHAIFFFLSKKKKKKKKLNI